MKLFDTSHLNEKVMRSLSDDDAACIYNGLDVCVTAEIFNVLTQEIEEDEPCVKETYKTALAKLAPIMEMSMRGTKIDTMSKADTMMEIEKEIADLDAKFQKIMREVFNAEVNWNSHVQLKQLFYSAMGLKEIKARNSHGIWAPTVNEGALDKLEKHLYAKPIVRMVKILRTLRKQLSFLNTEIDPDGRMRTTYNLAGTNTGRLASSMSDFGTGTNLQNVNRKLRHPFVADEGMYLLNIDLEQADGRNVGAICWELFHDYDAIQIARLLEIEEWSGPVGPEFAGSYLDACESGDLHTTVCKMVWPDSIGGKPWPDLEDEWKSFCDSIIAHGQDSFRQLSKKGGHGTNYYGTPRTMASHLHMPTFVIEDFQRRYFDRFPCIPAWHKWVISQLLEFRSLTTLFGRRRFFFGRSNDASTIRKAIAYAPQSMTGEQIDRGLLQIWRKYPQVQLLNQVHDSILLQIPFSEATYLVPRILDVMQVTLTLTGGRQFTVPLDAAGGWNWGYFNKAKPNENPLGLKKWTGREERQQPRRKKVSKLLRK